MTHPAIVLLRAINLGSHHKLPMAQLVALLEQAQCTEVQTYIQSGNVILRSKLQGDALRKHLESQLLAKLGVEIPVVVCSLDHWHTLAARCPFEQDNPTHLHVMFFAQPLAPVPLLEPLRYAPERFAIDQREIFLHLPKGMGVSKLAPVISRKYPEGTARNWRTVLALTALAEKLTA
ncbi:MAG: DUF1697 domain-containing protein [Deltaproteobacteria bacterium]|nr:DUF1697 domain-containing protein [Deltaproteobacteria bacterium]